MWSMPVRSEVVRVSGGHGRRIAMQGDHRPLLKLVGLPFQRTSICDSPSECKNHPTTRRHHAECGEDQTNER